MVNYLYFKGIVENVQTESNTMDRGLVLAGNNNLINLLQTRSFTIH